MKYREFLEYMENHLEGYHTFMDKARAFQNEKNARRPAKNRWNDNKVEKAAYDMWKMLMENLYNQIKPQISSDLPDTWASYIEKNLVENINESINDMDFSDDGAA